MATYKVIDGDSGYSFKVVPTTDDKKVIARFDRMSDALDFVTYLNRTEAH